MGGMRCMDCHKPVIGQQLSDDANWVSGNYSIAGTNAQGQLYLESRLLAGPPRASRPSFFCRALRGDVWQISTQPTNR